ncbi:bile acid:sodium symporter family protein [Paenibacillus chondroitinus]|uniref:Bile acid:sodium symporter family protein n=1 Tax=Paenibacillus chondroitinus TaxID=59842 RepID=A0ABU6DBA3_9BACL|nr:MULTISPECIES: bile acid:sodium symporter family protein [Paenibacillus]MCY9657655.1 bile acid:sodium symporter family protein [Paenibacillus anseongense]MEB4794949.1 bile acid:sodium symporter family protein [Paenibacillus chondroitinus]
MLAQLNRQLEKILPLITPVSVLIGVLLGSHLSGFTFLSPWLFAFMTFSGSISSSFKEFVKVIVQPFPLITTLLILHVGMPLLALGLGHAVYSSEPLTITGLILAAAIPTGITSFVWVAIYRGNIVLTLSIILMDTVLSPFVVPYTLSALVGTKVQMDTFAMMQGLFFMIVVPSLLGMLLNQWTKGKIKEQWSGRLGPFSKICMGIVVAINSSVIAPYLRDFNAKLLGLAGFVLALASLGYILGWIVAKLMKWEQDVVVALTFNSGMRNISAGAVLAVAYFPPPVAIPVVLGMLFQQSLASLFGFLLNRKYALKSDRPNLTVNRAKQV